MQKGNNAPFVPLTIVIVTEMIEATHRAYRWIRKGNLMEAIGEYNGGAASVPQQKRK